MQTSATSVIDAIPEVWSIRYRVNDESPWEWANIFTADRAESLRQWEQWKLNAGVAYCFYVEPVQMRPDISALEEDESGRVPNPGRRILQTASGET